MKHRRGSVSGRLSMHRSPGTLLNPSINDELHALTAVHEESSRSPSINNTHSAHVNGDKKRRELYVDRAYDAGQMRLLVNAILRGR